jgi:hypothetical protein
MQLVASYPCQESHLTPHIGKEVLIITTTNETHHGWLEQVRTNEIVISKSSAYSTTPVYTKQKAKVRRFPYPAYRHGYPYPGYPGYAPYPGYGAGSLVLPLFLLASMYARPY